MDKHNQIHNDIKPQNYLVKFLKGKNDLSCIEIVLTGFGLAGSDSKDGAPIFASPECMANPERKNKSSDIFSLGRVFLFSILSKEKFLKFLSLSLIKGGKTKIMKLIEKEPILNLISKMMRIRKRMDLQSVRGIFKTIVQIRNESTINEISKVIEKSTSKYTNQNIDILNKFS